MNRQKITAVCTCLVVIAIAAFFQIAVKQKDAKDVVKVGFVYIGDESNPYVYNFIRAQKNIQSELGDKVKMVEKFNVPENEVEQPLVELAEEKCDIIFTTSYGYGKTTKEIAGKYPDIQFCQATGDNANTEPFVGNYHTYMGAVYQGRYIAGVVAGMKLKQMIDEGKITKEQAKVGYVGAYAYAEVISGYTAFLLGVRSVVPEAVMTVCYADTWSNYTYEKNIAKSLIRDGCVIISQHSDTMGPAVACEEMNQNENYEVYHVGYNQGMTSVAPTSSLIGCKVNWEPYEKAAIQAVRQGKEIESVMGVHTEKNDAWGGLQDDWVQMLELNKIIAAPGSEKAIEKAKEQFARGTCKVFYGDYTGTDPDDPSDTIDLSKEYIENEKASAPGFHYQLDDIITVKQYQADKK